MTPRLGLIVLWGVLLLTVGFAGRVVVADEPPVEPGKSCAVTRAVGYWLKDAWLRVGLRLLQLERDRERRITDALLAGELIVKVRSDVEFRFVYVPPGRVTLGFSEEDSLRLGQETGNLLFTRNARPQVTIRVVQGYFILDREMTEEQFAALMPLAEDKPNATDLPSRNVTWEEAMTFCDRLGREAGYRVRLPTEIEWEYAARGPWPQRYPWPRVEDFHAWAEQGDLAGPRRFDPKGQDVSWRGVSDLAGNVSEWCLDLYKDRCYDDVAADMPYNPGKVSVELPPAGRLGSRTYRGGSFKDQKARCEVSVRRSLIQDERKPAIGFRPAIVFDRPLSPAKEKP